MKTFCPNGSSLGCNALAKVTFAFLTMSGLLGSPKSHAGVDFWTNNSATNNLSNAIVLWKGGANPASGDAWVFANPSNASLTNNFAAGFNVGGITFTNGTGVDVIGGNSIQLSSGITNNSTNLQTLNIALAVPGTITVAANSNNLLLGGAITGTGGLTFTGTNTTTLSGSNGYTGVTTLSGGVLVVSNAYGLGGTNAVILVTNGTSSLVIGSGIGTMTLGAGNAVKVGANATINNNSTLQFVSNSSSPVYVSGGQTLTLTGSGTTIFSGANVTLMNLSASNSGLIITNTSVQLTNQTGGSWNFGNGTVQIGSAMFNGGANGNGIHPGANGATIILSTGGILTNTFLKLYGNETVVLTNGGTFYGGIQNRSGNNSQILIGSTNGTPSIAYLNGNNVNIGAWATVGSGGATFNSNRIVVGTNGLVTNVAQLFIGGTGQTDTNASFNQVIVTNGGQWSGTGAVSIGGGFNANSNSLTVVGPGSAFNAGGANITVGMTNANSGNVFQVLNGGMFNHAGTITLDGTNSMLSLGGGTLVADAVVLNNPSTTMTLSNGGGTKGALWADTNGVLLSGSGTLVVSGGEIDANGYMVTNTGTMIGAGTLAMNANGQGGTLTLSGSNAFSGSTVIGGGVLNLGSSGSLAASTNIVISGGNLMIGGSNQISTNAPVTLGAGTMTLTAPDSAVRSPGLKIPSLSLSGAGVLDYSSLTGTSLVSVGALSGLGTNYAGGAKGVLNVWNWDSSTNASTLLAAGNATNLSALQLANINFYAGSGTLFLGSATLSSGGLRPVSSLIPNIPSLQVGGGSGASSYAVTNAIGCINISLLGNATLTYAANASTLSGSGSVTILGSNNILSLSGNYPSGYFNVLLSGSSLSISPGASFAVTGSAVGNTTLTVGQSYTNTNSWSIVALQTNATSVFLAVSGWPQFHVSPSGNDTNPGTSSLPFATIQRAQQAVRDFRSTPVGSQQEVDVILHAGTYWQTNTLSFTNTDSGGPGAPVVYTNAPGDLVAISGGRVITGTWTQSPGKPYWQISIPDVQAGKWAFNSLTVNGQSVPCARYPNVGEKELRGLGAEPGGDPLKSLVYHTGDFDPTWTNQQDISIVWMGNWTGEMHSVNSVDPVKQVLRFDNPSTVHTVYYYEKLMRYYLRNVFEKLDSPGEWYLNKTTGILYYYPRPGEDLSSAEVIAPVVKTPLVSISGNLASNLPVQYIQFKGIHFRHADTDIQAHDNMYRQGFMFLDGSVTATAFRNGLFQGCTFEQLGDYALNLADGCRDVTVQQCHFWDLGAGAVLIGVTDLFTVLRQAGSTPLAPGQAEPLRLVTNIVVDNNIVHRTGTIWNGPYGIVNRFASYTKITHNEIFDTDWTAIGLDARWDRSGGQVYAQGNEVAYNSIHHVGLNTQTDGGGIYQQGPMDTHIHHNIIHDTFPYPFTVGLEGIYCDANCLGVLAEKNILYNLRGNCFFQNISDSNAFVNNIGAFARDGLVHMGGLDTNNLNYALITRNIYATTNSLAQKDGYPVGSKPSLVTSNFFQTLQSNTTLLYNGNTLTNWQKLGWDLGSVEGNAGLTDPLNGDFSVSPTAAPVTMTGFVPFGQEMTTVGLYGDSSWTSLPATQPMRSLSQYQSFQDLSIYNEFSIDPNLFGNGVTMPVFNVDQTNCMIVTNGVPGINGPNCIQAIENTNNALSYDPYAKLSLYGLTQGRVQLQVAFLQPTNAPASCTIEFRGTGYPYNAGPSIRIASNGLLSAGKWSYQVTPGRWNMFTISCGLGSQGNGTYSLTVSNSSGVTNTTQPFVSTNFVDMTSLVIYSGDTNSSGSYYLDAISFKTTPTLPTVLIASNGVTNVMLNWSAIPGALGYLVQRSGSSDGVFTNLIPAYSGTSCSDVPPTAGAPYYYMVSATNALGVGISSDPVSAGLLPAAPSPTASSDLRQVLLSWASVPSATSYTLLRSSFSGGLFTPIATGLTNLSYSDAAVTGGNNYFYVLTASNAVGTGAASTQVSATALTPIQSWRKQWFGTTVNSGTAADTANPSGDGIPNLMKYAFGLNPLSTNATARPYAVLSNGCLQISFTMTNDPVLIYGVEATGDFSTWTNIWNSTGASNSNGPVTVCDTNAPVSSTSRRFLRLRVTTP